MLWTDGDFRRIIGRSGATVAAIHIQYMTEFPSVSSSRASSFVTMTREHLSGRKGGVGTEFDFLHCFRSGSCFKFTACSRNGNCYILPMRTIAKRTLREFWLKYPDSEQPLKAWHQEAARAEWSNPAEVKSHYRNASLVGDRVVFNIAGNKYRLVVWINYATQIAFVKFVGTHKQYDNIDVKTI